MLWEKKYFFNKYAYINSWNVEHFISIDLRNKIYFLFVMVLFQLDIHHILWHILYFCSYISRLSAILIWIVNTIDINQICPVLICWNWQLRTDQMYSQCNYAGTDDTDQYSFTMQPFRNLTLITYIHNYNYMHE